MVITDKHDIFYLPCGDLCVVERGPSTTAGVYLGCFADAAGGGRVLGFEASSDDMDAQVGAGRKKRACAPAARELCALLDLCA